METAEMRDRADWEAARWMVAHGVSLKLGFIGDEPSVSLLPSASPLVRSLEDFVRHRLPVLIAAGPRALQETTLGSDLLPWGLVDEPDVDRVATLLGIVRGAYVSMDLDAPCALLRLHEAHSKMHGRPAILTYQDIVLSNARRIDATKAWERYNIAPSLPVGAGFADFQTFVAACCACEIKGGQAVFTLLKACIHATRGADGIDGLTRELENLVVGIDAITTELVDGFLDVAKRQIRPLGFFDLVRPMVKNIGDVHGASAAQSPLFATLDAGLGVQHSAASGAFLRSEESYMHPKHRALIEALRARPQISDAVKSFAATEQCKAAYNACVDALIGFRRQHILVAKEFVLTPAGEAKASAVGTGGLPVMGVLLPVVASTRHARLDI